MSELRSNSLGIEADGRSRVEQLLERANVARSRWADRLLAASPDTDGGGDDHSIAAGLAVGDESAFRLLVERETERLFRICFRLLGSQAAAEQATAAAFARAWATLETYDPALRPAAWLSAVATREAWRDRLARREHELVRDSDTPWTSAGEASLETHLEGAGWSMDASERFATRLAISSLPDLEREAVSLCFFGELSLDEVAALTGRSESDVSASLESAVDLLGEASSSVDAATALGT